MSQKCWTTSTSIHAAFSVFGHRLTTQHHRKLKKVLHPMKTVSTWTSGGWCDASHIFCFSCFSELLTFKMALILLCLAIIGPPVISLSGYENCLNISISLPVETTITDQMRQFYKSVSFNISWKKAGQSEVSAPVGEVFICVCSEGHSSCQVVFLHQILLHCKPKGFSWYKLLWIRQINVQLDHPHLSISPCIMC